MLDEHWPFSCLQLFCDATVDEDPDLVVDVMMAVGGRMSGQPLGEDTRPFVKAMASTATGFIPPTARFKTMPPKSSMPGTIWDTR